MVDLITQYGLALVFVNVLVQQLGLPIPALPTLIVAGALAADGKISALALFGVAFVACAISDATWYSVGRLYGRRVMQLLCRISLSPESCVRQSQHLFHRWGRLTFVVGKFVPGLLTLSPAMAGTMALSGWSFALLDGLGAAIWAGVAIGTGMLLHREISQLIGHLQELREIAIAAIGLLLVYVAGRWWQRRRFHNRVQRARISADELHRLIAEGQQPLIVDLRTPFAREQDNRFVPNALRMDLEEVDQWLDHVPTGREIIFYCTCPNDAGAAYVARKLMHSGYTRVRPLLGGLDAWIAAGYPVESGRRAPPSAPAVPISDETQAIEA
jgi:membrane protein DedA with SNARE-associated domain/rhodanese-related sulfurtransferase